jgi:hypothetical protein
MKFNFILVIPFLFIHFCCTSKDTRNIIISTSAESDIVNTNANENIENDEYLYIGGQRTIYKQAERDNITRISINLNTEKGNRSLEGIELLKNLRTLSISGQYIGHPIARITDISRIDFSPLNSLDNLENLYFDHASFTTIPDFSNIPSLEYLSFWLCQIKSMTGIENIQQIHKFYLKFWLSIPENLSLIFKLNNLNMLEITADLRDELREETFIRIADMSGMTELRQLSIEGYQNIDLYGIQNLSQLEFLSLGNKNEQNIQYLSELKKLTHFYYDGINPSIVSFDFLSSLNKLSFLKMRASGNSIDITLLRNMRMLEEIWLLNFEIKKFHILNNLPELKKVYVYNSVFYPENNNKLKYAEVEYEYIDGH